MDRGKNRRICRRSPLFRSHLPRLDLIQHFLIKIGMRFDALIDRKLPFDALTGGGSEALPLLGVALQLKDGIADGLRISGGTTNPVSPCRTASALPPTSVTIIASPAAMPSRMTLEKPSSREVKRPKSAAASRRGMSEYSPRN